MTWNTLKKAAGVKRDAQHRNRTAVTGFTAEPRQYTVQTELRKKN